MGGYAVTPEQLQHADAQLATTVQHVRAELARVRACADSVAWHGTAAAAFRLAWEQWLEGAGLMLDALEATAVALGAAAGGYEATEQAVRASLVAR